MQRKTLINISSNIKKTKSMKIKVKPDPWHYCLDSIEILLFCLFIKFGGKNNGEVRIDDTEPDFLTNFVNINQFLWERARWPVRTLRKFKLNLSVLSAEQRVLSEGPQRQTLIEKKYFRNICKKYLEWWVVVSGLIFIG